MVYRYKDKWLCKECCNLDINDKQFISIKNKIFSEECSFLIDDDEEIDFDFLIEYLPQTWKVNIPLLETILDNYTEKWGYPEDKAKEIIERYSSFILVDFEITPENIENWIKSHCKVEA
jgi:hypothetical protein